MQLKQNDPKIGDVAAQLYALHMAVTALICTHPNREQLRASFGFLADHHCADLLRHMTPDSFIDEVNASVQTLTELMA